MATLTIRNLPDELHSFLKNRAKKNRRSLNQEIIAELVEIQQREEIETSIYQRVTNPRTQIKGFLTPDEIDDARRDGRL